MNKLTTLFFTLLCFYQLQLFSQNPTIAISPTNTTVDPGGNFCVDIPVTDFEDVAAVQFKVNWTPGILQLDSFTNVNPNIPPGQLSINQPNDSLLIVLWIDFNGQVTFTIPDGESFLTLCYTAIGDSCDVDDLIIDGAEVVYPPFNQVDPTVTNGTVNLSCGGTPTCGITSIETGNQVGFSCNSNTPGDNNDGVDVIIGFTGSDTSAMIVNNGMGNATGNLAMNNGSIIITGLMEGDSWDISITGGSCNLSSTGTIPSAECDPVQNCGITDMETGNEVTINCNSNTTGNNNDGVTILIGYTGSDALASITNNGAGNATGNLAVNNGQITLTGLQEGDSWNVSITGNGCNLNSTGTVGASLCDPPPPVCGITDIETGNEVTITCNTNTTGNNNDGVTILIGYTGSDALASITNNGAGNATGNLAVNNGQITLTGLQEGDSWNVSITGNGCNLNSTGTVGASLCDPPPPVCGITDIETGNEVTITCNTNTAGNNNDGVTIVIGYTGADALASITNNGAGNATGDLSVNNGDITITGLQEGDSWNVSITGNGCNLTSTGTVASDLCNPAPSCGISDLETGNEASITCNTNTTGSNNDGVTVVIGYTGSDPLASITNNGAGTATGDLSVNNGDITITGLQEGDSWNISITGNTCNLNSTGTIGSNICDPVMGGCGITDIETNNEVTINCNSTSSNTNDPVTVIIGYTGADPQATIVNNGLGTVSGDLSVVNGSITITGLVEGDAWDISITGNNCNLTSSGGVPSNYCFPVPTTNTDSLIIYGNTVVDSSGEQVCIEVRASNFVNVATLQFTIDWNGSVMSLDSASGISAPFLDGGNATGTFGPINPGHVTFTWNASALINAVTVQPDGELFFKLYFTLIGNGGACTEVDFNDSEIDVEVVKAVNGVPFLAGLINIPGEACILGGDFPAQPLKITVSDEIGQPGDTVCVDFTVENFVNMTGLQFSVNWDSNIVNYVGVDPASLNQTLNLDAMANFNSTQADQLRFTWADFTGDSLTLPPGDLLFSACFEIIGNLGQMTPVDITDNPIDIEAFNTDSMIPVELMQGSISVQIPPMDPVIVTVLCPDESTPGSTISIPITVDNFAEIIAANFTVNWDSTVLAFNNISFVNSAIASSSFNTPPSLDANTIAWLWFDQAGIPVTIPNGETLFTIDFDVIGQDCDSSIVDITDNFLDIIFATPSSGSTSIPFEINPCFADIDCPMGPEIMAVITHVSCNGGNDGEIDITITDGDPPYTVDWQHIPGNDDPEDLTGLLAGMYTVTVTDMMGVTATETYTVTEPDPVSAQINISHASCFDVCDGGVILTVSGGTPAYTYDWADLPGMDDPKDRSGLCDGNYSVTITDSNQCTFSAPVVINEPAEIIVTGVVTDAGCGGTSDGSIDLTVTGGSGSYNYTWTGPTPIPNTPDPTGLDPGDYFVTVTDVQSSCTGTAMFTVGQTAPFVVTPSLTQISCNGVCDGSISLMVTGGSGTYTYQWDPAITGGSSASDLCEGSYFITVTDVVSGCTDVQSFAIFEPNALNVTLDSVFQPLCPGDATGCIFVNALGGTPPISYEWINVNIGMVISNSPDMLCGLVGGTYTLAVEDSNGCTDTLGTPVSIIPPPPIVINETIIQPSLGANDGQISISISGGTGPYSSMWSNGMSGSTISNLAPDTYCVTVTDDNDCIASECYILYPPLQIVSDTLFDAACFGDSTGSIDISVGGGLPPYNYLWSNDSTTQDLNNVPAGTYFVTITDSDSTNNNQVIGGPYTIDSPDEISIATFSITCDNGSGNGVINITPAGGALPYSYQWSNGELSQDIIDLQGPDSFNVVIIDANNCIFQSQEFVLCLDIEPPLVDHTVKHVSCNDGNDGAIDTEIMGVAGPYSITFIGPLSSPNPDTIVNNPDPDDLMAGQYLCIVTDGFDNEYSDTITINQPPVIDIIIDTVIHESCPDGDNGQIFISVGGGNGAPYSYQWNFGQMSQDITGLQGNTYQVTVTDQSQCTAASNEIIVNGQPPCTCFETINHIDCHGDENGSVSIEVCGGTPFYSFNWENGDGDALPFTGPTIFDVPGGVYYVTITDAVGMMTVDSFLIDEPDSLFASAALTTSSNGMNGAIDMTVIGGTPMYTYLWDDSTTTQDRFNLPPGEYCVTITDMNLCQYDTCFIVIGAPAVTAITEDEVCIDDCNGSIDLNIIGVPPIDIMWQLPNGDSTDVEDLFDLCPGTYVVTVTDGLGISITDSYTIGTTSNMVVNASVTTQPSLPTSLDGEGTVFASSGVSPYMYEWCNGETGNTAFNLSVNDECIVTVTDAAGCIAYDTVTVLAPVIAVEFVVVDPSCPDECNGEAEVIPIEGREPFSYAWSSGPTSNPAVGLCAGTYTVTVTDNAGYEVVFEVVVEEGLGLTVSYTTTPSKNNDGTIELEVEGGTPPYIYQWEHGPPDPIIENLDAGTYTVTVFDAIGCIAVESIEVEGEFDCGTATKVISPNQDGFNDIFKINCALDVENTLEIYNRWGNRVLMVENYENDWEGTDLNGESVPPGGYFWVFTYQDKDIRRQIKGSLTIVR